MPVRLLAALALSAFFAAFAQTPGARPYPANPSEHIQPGGDATLGIPDHALGLTVRTLTPEQAATLHLPKDLRGVIVTDIETTSRAAKAGVLNGDVIYRINDQKVESLADYQTVMARADLRRPVLSINRHGQVQRITVRAHH